MLWLGWIVEVDSVDRIILLINSKSDFGMFLGKTKFLSSNFELQIKQKYKNESMKNTLHIAAVTNYYFKIALCYLPFEVSFYIT